jgi:hypothetical protein
MTLEDSKKFIILNKYETGISKNLITISFKRIIRNISKKKTEMIIR